MKMTIAVALAFAATACGVDASEPTPHVCIIGRTCPDAGVDAACTFTPDGDVGCCKFWPNLDEMRACANQPAHTCTEFACEMPDCTFAVQSVCTP